MNAAGCGINQGFLARWQSVTAVFTRVHGERGAKRFQHDKCAPCPVKPKTPASPNPTRLNPSSPEDLP